MDSPQGFEVVDNVVYQDNQSSILLEKNGTRSSGRRTRHLNIRYFFISDRVDKKEVRNEYCPAEIMRADPHTKALQGRLFREYRDWSLNLPASPAVESKECVGSQLVLEQNLVANEDGVQSEDSVRSDDSDDVVMRFDCDEAGWTTVVSKKVKRTRRFRK